MTIEDIKQGESEVLEFKREFPDKERKVLKTIVAFANGNGGNVVIRVDATTRVAERYKVQELSLLGMNKTFDEIVQNGTKEAEYKDIDFLIKAFSSRSKRQVTIQNFVSWKLLSEENSKYFSFISTIYFRDICIDVVFYISSI